MAGITYGVHDGKRGVLGGSVLSTEAVGATIDTVTVALFDQEPLLVRALSLTLEAIPGVRVKSGIVSSDFSYPADFEAEIVVCDPSVGNKFEPEILREFRRSLPQPRIIVLTNHTDPQAIASALEHGAQSIILKSETPEIIRQAVELTRSGAAVFSQVIASQLVANRATSFPQPERTHATRGLSSREAEVMHLVGRGRTDAEIAEEFGVSVRTIERHITNVLNKLNSRNRAEAITHILTTVDPDGC
jgi:DNA-binding NarL/FixJ family response regulator